MSKPQIHQVQEQIERANRNLGKLSEEQYYLRKRNYTKRNNERPDGEVQWRKVYFTRNHGISVEKAKSIRTLVKEVVNELKYSQEDFDTISSLNIKSADRSYSTSTINLEVQPKENVILYTTVRSDFNVTIPMEILYGRDLSGAIEVISNTEDGDPVITRAMTGKTKLPAKAHITIPAGKETTVMIYLYNGSGTTAIPFAINTMLYEIFSTFVAPAPFKPTGVLASLGDSLDKIGLTWDFDPFVTANDFVEIWKGNVNEDNETINNTFTRIATINAFSIKYIDDVIQGTRSAYKIRYASSNGGLSPFSDYSIGYAGSVNIAANVEMSANETTGVVGHYSSRAKFSIEALQPVRGISASVTDAAGNVFDDITVIETDTSRKNYEGTIVIDPTTWSEGTATLDVTISTTRIIGEEDDGLGENTGAGSISVEKTFNVDYTPPKISDISIARQPDRDEDGNVYTDDYTVFVSPDYENSYDLTANQSMGVFSVSDTDSIESSGIYQIQFSRNGKTPDEYDEWTEWKVNTSYAVIGVPYFDRNVISSTELRVMPITIGARIRDRAGNVSEPVSDTIYWVRERPLMDIALAGSAGDLKISLSWNKTSESQVREYVLYRAEGAFSTGTSTDPRVSQFEIARIKGSAITGYSDTNVTPGEYYSYAMRLQDGFGNVSEDFSNVVQDVTPTAPTATGEGPSDNPIQVPQFVTSKCYGHWDYINLEWTPNTEFNFVHYIVYRGDDTTLTTTGDAIAVATGVDPWFRDRRQSGVIETGTTYRYWLKAFNEYDAENAGPGTIHSNPIDISLSTSAPPAANWIPASIYKGFGFNHLAMEDVSDPTDQVAQYKIYRADVQYDVGITTTGDYEHIGSARASQDYTNIHYVDGSVVAGRNYAYKNAGVNQFGFEGDLSDAYVITGALSNYGEFFINFVDNGDFSILDSTGNPRNWDSTGGGAYTLKTSNFMFGDLSVQPVNTYGIKQSYIFCQPGQDYYASHYALSPAGVDNYLGIIIDFYEPNDVYIATSSFDWQTNSTTWVRSGFQFASPSTASRMDITISGNRGTAGPAYRPYIDGIQIEQYDSDLSPRPFAQSRTISADRIQAHSIIGDMVVASSFRGDVFEANTIKGIHIEGETITADKLAIGYAKNLVLNSELYVGDDISANSEITDSIVGWNTYGETTEAVKQGGSASYRIAGTNAVRFTSPGLATAGYASIATNGDISTPLDTDSSYTISFYARNFSGTDPDTDGLYCKLWTGPDQNNIFDSEITLVEISGSDFNNLTVETGGGWHRFSAYVPPANFDPTKPYFSIEIGSSGLRDIVVDAVQLERGRYATEFSRGLTEIDGGQIKTDSIVARHITSSAITTDKLAAGSVTADKLAVGLASGEKYSGSNVMFNPSLEVADPVNDAAFEAPGWLKAGASSSNILINTDTSKMRDGNSSAKFDGITTIGAAHIYTDPEQIVPIDPNETYTFSLYANAELVSTNIYVRCKQYRSNRTQISDATIMTPITAGGSYSATISGLTFPTSTTVDRYSMTISGTDNYPYGWHSDTRFVGFEVGAWDSDASEITYVDALQFEWGTQPSPYNRGVVVIESGMILAGSINATHIGAATITGGHIEAGTIDADKLTFRTGGSNLLYDGGLTRWNTAGTSLDRWTYGGTLTRVTGVEALWEGTCALTTGTDANSLYHNEWIRIPEDSSGNKQSINLSFWVKRPTTDGTITARIYCASGESQTDMGSDVVNRPYVMTSEAYTSSGKWTRLNAVLDAADWPTNSEWFRPGIWTMVDNALGNKEATYIDGIQVTVGDELKEWMPNEGTVIDGERIKTGNVSSTNYSPGSAGWNIDLSGDAEFSTGTFRGGVVITDGATIQGDVNIDGSLLVFSGGRGTNLLKNSDLTVPEAYDSNGDHTTTTLTEDFYGWVRGADDPSELSNIKTYIPFFGSNSIQFSNLSSIGRTYITNYWYNNWPTVATGENYTLSFYMKNGSSVYVLSGFAQVVWYSKDYVDSGVLTLTTTGGLDMSDIKLPNDGEWYRYWGYAQMPENAYYAEISIGAYSNSAARFYLDGIQFEKGNGPSDYSSQYGVVTNTRLTHNSISTTNLQAESITTEKIAAEAVTANEIAAGTITADKLAFSTAAPDRIGGNMMQDGSFEAWDIDGDPIFWRHSYSAGVIGKASRYKALFGQRCLVATGSVSTPIPGGPQLTAKEWIPIPFDGDGNPLPFNFSFYIKRPAIAAGETKTITARFKVTEADGNGDPVEDSSGEPTTLTSSYWPYVMSSKSWTTSGGEVWTRVSSFITSGQGYFGAGESPYDDWDSSARGYPISAGNARFFKPAIWLGSGTPTDNVYLDGVQLTVGTGLDPYKDTPITIIDAGQVETGKLTSTNYSPGTAGWQIDYDGDAEFSDVTIRGSATIYGDALVVGTVAANSLVVSQFGLINNGSFDLAYEVTLPPGVFGVGTALGGNAYYWSLYNAVSCYNYYPGSPPYPDAVHGDVYLVSNDPTLPFEAYQKIQVSTNNVIVKDKNTLSTSMYVYQEDSSCAFTIQIREYETDPGDVNAGDWRDTDEAVSPIATNSYSPSTTDGVWERVSYSVELQDTTRFVVLKLSGYGGPSHTYITAVDAVSADFTSADSLSTAHVLPDPQFIEQTIFAEGIRSGIIYSNNYDGIVESGFRFDIDNGTAAIFEGTIGPQTTIKRSMDLGGATNFSIPHTAIFSFTPDPGSGTYASYYIDRASDHSPDNIVASGTTSNISIEDFFIKTVYLSKGPNSTGCADGLYKTITMDQGRPTTDTPRGTIYLKQTDTAGSRVITIEGDIDFSLLTNASPFYLDKYDWFVEVATTLKEDL